MQKSHIRNTLDAFVLGLSVLYLAGCSPEAVPARTGAAKEQLTKLGNHVISVGDSLVDPIDRAGDAVSSGVDATRSVLTSFGDGVLKVTTQEDPPKKDVQPK
jgi:hypothetical protein